jgi:dTDP-4-dehydrorhamnose reductase
MSVHRVLLVGSNGLLGQKVTELLQRGSTYEVTATSVEPAPVRLPAPAEYRTLDITSRRDVRATVSALSPDVIINAAAMTNVDACEHERELAWKINVEGVENLIDAARKAGSRIIHISTDYVFDGKAGPYAENDRPEPLNYYGKTKLASENLLRTSDIPFLILRTIVLYGHTPGVRPNFALWLLDSLERGTPVRVVDDQTGNPTLVDDLAYAIMAGIDLGRTGFYHVAGRNIVSRLEFARTLATVFGLNADLISPVKTAELSQPAARPLKSGLITLKAEIELGIKPATVEEGLRILKSQLQRSGRRMEDSPPLPSRGGPRSPSS